jgi:hypothetical protein
MLFILLAKFGIGTIMKIDSEEKMIWNNRLVLLIGFSIYLTFAGLIYLNKIPTFNVYKNIQTDIRFILTVASIDYFLYYLFHRFTYGKPPLLSIPPNDTKQIDIKESTTKPVVASTQQTQQAQQPIGKPQSNFRPPQPPDESLQHPKPKAKPSPRMSISSEVNIVEKGVPIIGELDDVKEVSVPGGDYFKDDDSNKAHVENWDTDDFTHEEFVAE